MNIKLWNKEYEKLEYYFNENGHSMVDTNCSKNKTKAENKLANWVARQRVLRNELSPMQVSQLNGLNFIWVTDLKTVLEVKMCDLKELDKEFIEMTYKNLSKTLRKIGDIK